MILLPALSVSWILKQKADELARSEAMTGAAPTPSTMGRRHITAPDCMRIVDTCWSMTLSQPSADMCDQVREYGGTCLYDSL